MPYCTECDWTGRSTEAATMGLTGVRCPKCGARAER